MYPCVEPTHTVACVSRSNCILLALGKINKGSMGSSTFSVQLWLLRRGCESICIQILRHPEPEVTSLSFSPASIPFLALICTGKSVSTTWISLSRGRTASQTSTAAQASSPLFSNFYCADDPVMIAEQLDAARRKKSREISLPKLLGGLSCECFPAAFGMRGYSLICAQSCRTNPGIDVFTFDFNGFTQPIMLRERSLKCDTAPTSVAMSPCGIQLASCVGGGHFDQRGISLWCLRSGNLLTTFGRGNFTHITYMVSRAAVVLASYEEDDSGSFLPSFKGFKLWM